LNTYPRKLDRDDIARPKSIYYVLASEQFPVPELIEYGVAAEKAGFDGGVDKRSFRTLATQRGTFGFSLDSNSRFEPANKSYQFGHWCDMSYLSLSAGDRSSSMGYSRTPCAS